MGWELEKSGGEAFGKLRNKSSELVPFEMVSFGRSHLSNPSAEPDKSFFINDLVSFGNPPTTNYETGGHRFESCRAYHFFSVR